MTDNEDIKESKVIKKLADGDMLDASTGEVKQDSTGICRVLGTAVKGGEVGWITTKGNAGTVFAEVVPKYYSVLKEVHANKAQAEGANTIRKLDVGETFKMLEGPREEKAHPEFRIKVRASDGS